MSGRPLPGRLQFVATDARSREYCEIRADDETPFERTATLLAGSSVELAA